MSAAPAIDAGRVIADLRELQRRTGSQLGAERLCWTPGWRSARDFLTELLAEIGLEAELDEAGNLWATMPGRDRSAPALALGSHLDSVPAGGWLDGALGVMSAVGVLRAYAAAGSVPARDLTLVDWADEEGARFGRSLFGSSAFSGSLDPAELRGLRDGNSRPIEEVLGEHGVELARASGAARRRTGLGAYLELHIEQGPVLEGEGRPVAAVSGCAGVERVRFAFRGRAAHAGTTPMTARRDAGLAAAEAALAIERLARAADGVATSGELRLSPGIATAVAGRAELTADLRHPEGEVLARMLEQARAGAAEAAGRRDCELEQTPLWRIEPLAFDRELVALASEVVAEQTDSPSTLTSGALHDAAEVSRVLPAAMLFCASRGGISHAPEEDTGEEDLVHAIQAFWRLATRV